MRVSKSGKLKDLLDTITDKAAAGNNDAVPVFGGIT